MKSVLFDQNVPRPLLRFLKGYNVKRARDLGLDRVKNGKLLDAAEALGFDVLLSGDKTIRYEQNMTGRRRISLVYMSDNHLPVVQKHIPAIIGGIDSVVPGEVRAVYCGAFLPTKSRK